MARRAEQLSWRQLAQVFNQAVERLAHSFEQLRRFTSDASHELRTPLTVIRSVGEVGMQSQGSASYYREVISSMLEAANRLTRLVESLTPGTSNSIPHGFRNVSGE